MASIARHHADWLRLVETSGPFLSMPVLLRAFPQGLERHEPEVRAELEDAYAQWRGRGRHARGDPRAIHRQWVLHVLTRTLGLPEALLLEGQALPAGLNVPVSEHCEVLSPHWALVNPAGRSGAGVARLLVRWYEDGQGLQKAVPGARWVASPVSRMVELLRAANVRLGLVTNGEHWVLVHAPRGETSGAASFFAHLWQEEKLTLQAFRSLLGVERFFNQPDSDTLEGLFAESAHDQQEVTDQLGSQVRRAVELLVKALDRIDRERRRELLAGVSEKEVYEAAVSVMMRLVFLFCAEERGLLMLGEPLFDACYAVSTLRDQLREAEDRSGAEVLQRRHDAWARLLAVFRAVHGGVQHEAMRLPAYGGSLFDPDRFPFLEGRKEGTGWREQGADPLPIDNHTVLQLLEALQLLQVRVPGGVETRRLSFRALDVEQIGHIYEGLLDHTAIRARGPVLGLVGAKGQEPEVPLAKLEELRGKGSDPLVDALVEETGKSTGAIRKAVEYEAVDEADGLLRACEHDEALYERVKPFAGLVREDEPAHPVVILDGSLYVTQGSDRRTTGTHYTPRSLTEEVVRYALEPLVYEGPVEGKPAQEWRLRSAKELLGLKICDFAMGSGAFLVQACRYLSERLVEAWDEAERRAEGRLVVTPEGELSTGATSERSLPRDPDERLAIARRIVADRCLFGVDKNPMAVEMAKLSLWLVTLQKNRPFTFVDHALRAGDSLLGVTDLKQVEQFDLSGVHGTETKIAQRCRAAVRAALESRRRLESFSVETAADVERKQALLAEAERALADVWLIADLLMGAVLRNKGDALEEELERIVERLAHAMDPAAPEVNRERYLRELRDLAEESLGGRSPLHWPLEFPEVFEREEARGFDAVVGNPPFLGGQKITGALGTDYRDYLVERVAGGQRGSADLCAYFFLRAGKTLKPGGAFGLLATNTIAQGDTREVGLEQLVGGGCSIVRAVPSRKWPGEANLEVAYVWARKGAWAGGYQLEDKPVAGISPFLAVPGAVQGKPYRLKANEGKSYIGSYVLGMGFVLSPQEAQALIERDPRNRDVLFPYLNGEDLNSRPDQSASRWVINFRDWPLDRESAPDGYEGPVAADFPDCLEIVRTKVKPERERNNRRVRRERWWQFAERAPELYATIAGMERVLLKSEVGNRISFAWSPSKQVFSHMLIAFATEDDAMFGVLQSSVHELWARNFGSSMRTDLRYTPSDCFDTFPLPEPPRIGAIKKAATEYALERQAIMAARGEGLTKLYAALADRDRYDREVVKLRSLHSTLDAAVALAYSWDDVDLGHGFHDTKQGVRFTVSDSARREILARLLKLNHDRYAEEVGQGLHDKQARRGGAQVRPAPQPSHPTLFDLAAYSSRGPERSAPGRDAAAPGTDPADAIHRCLQEAGTSLGKSDLVKRSGVADSDWAGAIKKLLADKRVLQEGKGRGVKYALPVKESSA